MTDTTTATRRVPADLPEIEARPEEPRVADPVFALYQRMVGWE